MKFVWIGLLISVVHFGIFVVSAGVASNSTSSAMKREGSRRASLDDLKTISAGERFMVRTTDILKEPVYTPSHSYLSRQTTEKFGPLLGILNSIIWGFGIAGIIACVRNSRLKSRDKP